MVRKITDFADGTYRVYLEEIDESTNCVHAMLHTKGGRKYRLDISLAFLKKFYLNKLTSEMAFDMTVIDNSQQFKFDRIYFSRVMRRRAAYSKLVAKTLQEEFGSVEGFLQYHEIPLQSDTQKNIYGLLKQAQHENRIQ